MFWGDFSYFVPIYSVKIPEKIFPIKNICEKIFLIAGLLEKKCKLFSDFSCFGPIYSIKIPQNKIRVKNITDGKYSWKNIPDGPGKIGKSGIFLHEFYFREYFLHEFFFTYGISPSLLQQLSVEVENINSQEN